MRSTSAAATSRWVGCLDCVFCVCAVWVAFVVRYGVNKNDMQVGGATRKIAVHVATITTRHISFRILALFNYQIATAIRLQIDWGFLSLLHAFLYH